MIVGEIIVAATTEAHFIIIILFPGRKQTTNA